MMRCFTLVGKSLSAGLCCGIAIACGLDDVGTARDSDAVANPRNSTITVHASEEAFLLEEHRSRLRPRRGQLIGHVSDLLIDDSTIWIADALEANLKTFDHTGRHVATLGRSGNGPGEFGEPVSIVRSRLGTIAVLDRKRARVSIWTADGNEADSWPAKMPLANSLAIAESGHLAITGFARSPRGDRAVQFMDYRGNVLKMIGDAEPLRRPFEISFRVYVGDQVGRASVFTYASTNEVTEVLDDSMTVFRAGLGFYKPWSWEEDPSVTGKPVEPWLAKQIWTTGLFAVDADHYIVAFGTPVTAERRYRYNYALMRLGRGQVLLSAQTDVMLVSAHEGGVYGIDEALDGGVALIRFRFPNSTLLKAATDAR